MLLRAIPGRRWDPVERAWRVPLEPEQAQALALLLDGLPHEPEVSDALGARDRTPQRQTRPPRVPARRHAPRQRLVAELRHRRAPRNSSQRCSSTPKRARCRRSGVRSCRSTTKPPSCSRACARAASVCASAISPAARSDPRRARTTGRRGRRRRARRDGAVDPPRRRVPSRPARRALDPDRRRARRRSRACSPRAPGCAPPRGPPGAVGLAAVERDAEAARASCSASSRTPTSTPACSAWLTRATHLARQRSRSPGPARGTRVPAARRRRASAAARCASAPRRRPAARPCR